jgi:uncharacterized linocin/CFP29 family protein
MKKNKSADFYLNGQANGSVAARLMRSGFALNTLRPYEHKGRSWVSVQKPDGTFQAVQTNATALLRKDTWKELDSVVLRASRNRLNFVADLNAAGLTYNLPNGMAKSVLEYETMSDAGSATISMDPVRRGERDRPKFELKGIPLPIIHGDFSFTARQIAISQNSNTPLDTTMAEQVTQRVAEQAESLAVGLSTFSYGGNTVYGLQNFPDRMLQDLTDPTDSGWTPATLVREVLAMRQKSIDAKHFGPWNLYVGKSWDAYLDEDFKANGDTTLRERLLKIQGINKIQSLDYLGATDIVLLQMTSDVVRIINGIPMTVVQWEEQGGMEICFKVLCMSVPQFRENASGDTGVVHGTVV